MPSALTHEPEPDALLSADDFWSGESVMPEPVPERAVPHEQDPEPGVSGSPEGGEPKRRPFAELGGGFIPIGASAEDADADVTAGPADSGERNPIARRWSPRPRLDHRGLRRRRGQSAVAVLGAVLVVAATVALAHVGRGARSPVGTASVERHQVGRLPAAIDYLAPLTARELRQAAREAEAHAQRRSIHARRATARHPVRHVVVPSSVSASAPVAETGASQASTATGGYAPAASTYAPASYSPPPSSGATSGGSVSAASSQPAGPTSIGSAGANCDPKCS